MRPRGQGACHAVSGQRGGLHCTEQFLDANPRYEMLVKHGATLNRSKTVVDTFTAVSFIEGEYKDKTGVYTTQ